MCAEGWEDGEIYYGEAGLSKTKAIADGITQKLYRLMGDAGALENMVSAEARADWRTLANVYDQKVFNHHLLADLHRCLAIKAKDKLVLKTIDTPTGQEHRMFGFVFSEEQLLNLLYRVYQAGLDGNIHPVLVDYRGVDNAI